FTQHWIDRVILSADAIAGNGDDLVIGEFAHDGPLDSTHGYVESRTLTLSPSFQGREHVFVRTDATGVVFENGAEANNVAGAAATVDIMPIPYADLAMGAVTTQPTGH